MGRAIARNLGPVAHLSAGEYTVETASGEPAICCPACGGLSDIGFEVYRGGRVSQIWSCPYVSCAFVDYLDLEAWLEPVLT